MKRQIIALALASAVAASAGTASAATDDGVGFDTDTIAAFVTAETGRATDAAQLDARLEQRLQRLRTAGHLFRRIAAADTAALPKVFAPFEAGALDSLLGSRWHARAPAIWRYFFRYTFTFVGGLDGEVSRVGYYNPLIDGWVFVDWRWTEGERPAFERAEVAVGEVLRGEAVAGDAPGAWTTGRRGPAVTALQSATIDSARAFSRLFPPRGPTAKEYVFGFAPSPVHRDMVALRLVAALLSLSRHYRDAGFADRTEAFLEAASQGLHSALDAATATDGAPVLHRIAGMPTFTRKRLELAAFYPTAQGAIAVFAVPMVANGMLVSRYTKGADLAIDGLAILDLTEIGALDNGGQDVK